MIALIDNAVKIIINGGVVAFPTETVYGLGADATSDAACAQIYKIKSRPAINPLIIHVANLDQATKLGEFNEDAYKLAEFWPGPLTLVLPKKQGANIGLPAKVASGSKMQGGSKRRTATYASIREDSSIESTQQFAAELDLSRNSICSTALAGLNTIAIRIPSHIVAQELLQTVNLPLAAPSANISGYITATSSEHVTKDFASVYVIPNDSSVRLRHNNMYGLESTIISCLDASPKILRHGVITHEMIEKLLAKKINSSHRESSVIAPGMLDKHYAPRVKLRLNAERLIGNEICLNFADSRLSGAYNLNLSNRGDLLEAASNLYSMLRDLDEYSIINNISCIAVAPVPNIGVGVAINDRLRRASHC